MMLYKITFWSICLITSALILPNHAQNTAQDFLNAHNSARNSVNVANIAWDDTLATYALNYANQRKGDCSLVPSGSTTQGENLGKGSGATFTAIAAVNQWTSEISNYNHGSNTCNTGTVCAHYTQVVWNTSVSVGCARVQCVNGWYFVGCSYLIKGNIAGTSPY